ncbi:MAG: rhomboid family intramembrane serine protease [Prevotellaceae bacterium]|jgi:membrane associated rhomboid family serine protease|nr:rhomboid family intramembrane serine protease [Prevotellaceae bacterium]
MMSQTTYSPEKERFRNALVLPFMLCFLIVLAFAVEKSLGVNFAKFGTQPREFQGLIGIFTTPFIHADIKHLLNNLLSLFILSYALFYFYRGIALKSLAFLWFVSGLLLWLIGRESYHIGASGLIYALAFFLFFSGIFRQHIPLIAISAVIVFVYGSLVWGLFPYEEHPEISWEGHLSGAVSGIIFAIIFRQYGPQKPVKVWEDEPDDENPFWLEQDNLHADNTD